MVKPDNKALVVQAVCPDQKVKQVKLVLQGQQVKEAHLGRAAHQDQLVQVDPLGVMETRD